MDKTKDKPRVIYWDTCVFISYIIGGIDRTPAEMSGIDNIVNEVEANRIILVTSVMTRVETLYDLYDKEKRNKFLNIFKRPNIQEIEVHHPIANLANSIRSQFKQLGITRLKSPDAIHLATAMWANVDEFQTFDGNGEQIGLINLDSHEILKGLRIVPPRAKQPYLPEF